MPERLDQAPQVSVVAAQELDLDLVNAAGPHRRPLARMEKLDAIEVDLRNRCRVDATPHEVSTLGVEAHRLEIPRSDGPQFVGAEPPASGDRRESGGAICRELGLDFDRDATRLLP